MQIKSGPTQSPSRTPKTQLLTTKEIMSFLRISHRQTIYKLIKQGMPVIIIGNKYRFIPEEVLAFLKKTSRAKSRLLAE
jgi:excisionase family DNA binding protein